MKYLYETIADVLCSGILTARIPRGCKLPSVRSLAAQNKCSAGVAVQALNLIERRGFAIVVPRSGFFATIPPSESPRQLPSPVLCWTQSVSGYRAPIDIMSINSQKLKAPLHAAIPSVDLLQNRSLVRMTGLCLRKEPHILNCYAEPGGDASLRDEVARLLGSRGCPAHKDEIVITAGCLDAIRVVIECKTRPGDRIAVETPCFFGLLEMLKIIHREIVEIPLTSSGCWSFEIFAKEHKTKAISLIIVMPNFQNPLGTLMLQEDRDRLLEFCFKNAIVVVEDDIYAETGFISRPKPLAADHSSVICCSSFSKTLAPGMRIGWILAREGVAELRKHVYYTSFGTPLLMQKTMANYLSRGGYQRYRTAFVGRLLYALRALEQTVLTSFPAGTLVSHPEGGFFVWIELPHGLSSDELLECGLREGISFAPGRIFSNQERFKNCLRISCIYPLNENMTTAVAVLGQLAHVLLGI